MTNRNINKQGVDVNGFSVSNNAEACCGSFGYRYTIEKHLHSFSNDAPYKYLWASWITEKENYRRRLETVSSTFSTYSSHSADHSEVILARIEALLGEDRIRLLSPTDTWMLLQCAYTHDLGMCVREDEKDKVFDNAIKNLDSLTELFNNEDFREFLINTDNFTREYTSMNSDPLTASVRYVLRIMDSEDNDAKEKLARQLQELSYSKAKNMLSTVITNYFRKRHAERTRNILMDEAQSKMLDGIFPIRLRQMVARIDYCHAGTWREAIDSLPYQENGIHTDYIHPQFVASLLRLGDLLDMDSNRFNVFQIDQVSQMPTSSEIHELKHMAITELLVTPREINIEARFRIKDVRGLLEKHFFSSRKNLSESDKDVQTSILIDKAAKSLRSWISWIQSDLKEFSTAWNFVIPQNMTGSLATLRKNDIYIEGRNTPIDEADLNLRYVISSMRASQLMIGADIYASPWSFVREIAQNAVDATKKYLISNIDNDATEIDVLSFEEYCKNYVSSKKVLGLEVNVSVEYVPADKNNLFPKLKFSFVDSGIGITYSKLKQMRHIGAITKTAAEKELLNGMPEWIKPTGEFGIGMQSIFAYTDSFKIITYPRNEETDIKRHICFNCPELGGDIVNREEQKKKEEKRKFGTIVYFDIELNEVNTQRLFDYDSLYTSDRRHRVVMSSKVVFDKLIQYINDTFTADVIPIVFTLKDKTRELDINKHEWQHKIEIRMPDFSMDEMNDIVFNEYNDKQRANFWFNSDDMKINKESVLFTIENSNISEIELYYKGIAIYNGSMKLKKLLSPFKLPNLSLKINIMSGKAADFLEINRDYIKPEGYRMVKECIKHALIAWYRANLDFYNKNVGEVEREDNSFRLFWSNNSEHFRVFAEVMEYERRKLDESLLKIVNDKEITYVDCTNSKITVGAKTTFRDWYNKGLWYIDSSLNNLPHQTIYPKIDDFRAVPDYISIWYGLYYDKIKIIKDSQAKDFTMIYSLTRDDSSFPHISETDYCKLCKGIISKYIEMYKNESDIKTKSAIGQYILVFPAIKKYEDISCSKVPMETPDELVLQYTRFIICPGTVKQLTQWANDKETVFWDNMTSDGKNDVHSFIKNNVKPLIGSRDSDEVLVEKYQDFLISMNDEKSNDKELNDTELNDTLT